jgi:acyl-CoA synthetase (AMP-forming)/AMP-acid ligase II
VAGDRVVRSPYSDVEIPDVPLTPFVLGGARTLGDKPALVDGPSGRVLTYAALAEAVDRVAAGLARRGFGPGDVFAIYSPNLPEYAVAFFGVVQAGGVVTTASPLLTADELASQLKTARAACLVTVPPLVDKAQAAARQSGIRELFVFGEADGATPFSALLAAEGPPPRVAVDPREDLVALPFSSGTTGFPKGVMLTHRNLVANVCQCAVAAPLRPDDVLIGVLPFFHIYGMVVTLGYGLWRGATIVTLPRFEPEPFLRALQDYRVTEAHLVPPIILMLASHPLVGQYNLSALRTITSGAAPLGGALAEACADRLGCVVKQGYGLTETSPVTHVNPADRVKSSSVGVCVPNTIARVIDTTSGTDLGPGEEGEILIRGPQVMRGYLDAPDATRATIDDDGWLHTGDIGSFDDEGYFYVTDRLKELIKFNGLQVAPAELEAMLLQHPAVGDVAVIPKPDPSAGEIPKALVVLNDSSASPDAIMDWLAARVAPYKKVREMVVVDHIPRSPAGKILRRVLIEQERQQRA